MSRSSRLTPERVAHVLFLPGDDDSLDERSSAACRALAEALDVGLSKTTDAFWAHVERNGPGLARSLDSYLQFKTRPFESRGDEDEASTSTADELPQKVFLTLLRLVNDGARERVRLTVDERRDILLKHSLIDVPKLIDVTVLYGQDNKDLAHEIVASAVKLLPSLKDDFEQAGLSIEQNLNEMVARVVRGSQRKELSTDGVGESLSYFHDVAISLLSLVAVYPLAGEWLCQAANIVHALKMVQREAIERLEHVSTDFMALEAVRDSVSAAIACLERVRHRSPEANEFCGIHPGVVGVIESVRTILPDLGIGFIKACVDHFGPNAELIVQHMFEESLPPSLKLLDKQLAWPPASVRSMKVIGSPQSKLGPSINKNNKEIDIELSAEDKKRVLMVAHDLEYEDEYDDSFDDLPVQVASTALEFDEMEEDDSKAQVSRLNTSKRAFYISDGKVYHSHKAGAEKVYASTAEEASTLAAAAAKIRASEIEGLGAGGNKAKFGVGFVPNSNAAPFVPKLSSMGTASEELQRHGQSSGGSHGRGSGGRGSGGRATGGRATRGLTAKDFAHKHHNQKAKAAKKAGL